MEDVVEALLQLYVPGHDADNVTGVPTSVL
jgi:hypothetical protein